FSRRSGSGIKRVALRMVNAATITRQSKSNLALGFISLGRERRRDMTVLYAFCRVIDDIADSPQLSLLEKRAQLEKWRRLLHASESGEPPLAGDVRVLFGKYSISPAMLEEIIAGVEMDLTIRRYATFEQLRVYCHRAGPGFADDQHHPRRGTGFARRPDLHPSGGPGAV